MANIHNLTLVVAVAQNGVIGHNQTLPWRLRSDLQRFKQVTMGHALLMGRKTFESIGRILPGRTTVVLTRNPSFKPDGALVANSLEMATKLLPDEMIPFVVGGAEVYRLAIAQSKRILLTRVLADVDGDAYFDCFDSSQWKLVQSTPFPAGPHDQYATKYEEWVRD